MANLGWIKFGVSADTGKFAKDMQHAAKTTDGFGVSLRNLVGAYVGFEALKMGVSALKGFVGSSMDAINSTRVMAERLGVSTESLSKLQYAAKIADVEQETLNGSLEKLNVRLAEVATEGKGPAADALKKLGLSAGELAKQGPVEAFHSLATVIEGIESPAERAAIAVDLFGKSGQGMLNLISQGKGGLAGLEAEADALGVSISAINAAKVDEADDAMTKLWAVVGGLGNTIAVELSPFITYAADSMVNFAKSAASGNSFVAQTFEVVATAAGFGLDAINAVGTGLSMLGEIGGLTIDFLGSAWGELTSTIGSMAESISAQCLLFDQWGESGVKNAGFISQAMDWITSSVGLIVDAVNVLKGTFYGLRSAISEILSYFASAVDKMVNGLIAILNLIPGIEGKSKGLYKTLSEDLHRLATEQFEAAGEAFSRVGEGKGTARKLIDDFSGRAGLGEGHDKVKDFLAQIKGGAEERAQLAVNAGKKFTTPGGDLVHEDDTKKKFAGAAELGSAEAYSSVVRNLYGGGGESEQRKIASSTERGAAAAERSNTLLGKMVENANRSGDLKPFMPGAT